VRRAEDGGRLADEGRERPPLSRLGAARRSRRAQPAGAPEGELDHAGQGQSGNPRGGHAGRGAGDRQRHGDHGRRHAGPFRAQRVRAAARAEHPRLGEAPRERVPSLRGEVHRRDRGQPGERRALRRADACRRDGASRQSPTCPNGLGCYSPSLIRQAYDFPAGAGAPTGAGQTILVVEAYGSPTIEADLAQFDAENGLPAPPSFSIVAQQTKVTDEGSGELFRWAIETSLDVQYAHAMAPGASIVLAVAATDSSLNIGELEEEVLPVYPGA